MRDLKAGSTSVLLGDLFVLDKTKTDGSGLAALAYNSSGLTCYYHRNTASASVAVSLANMTLGTFTSGGFKEVDSTNMPGLYQFCPPDAALATGAQEVVFYFQGATDMAPTILRVPLVQLDPQSAGVASVSGSVGSVTGAVGSVTGNVGGNVVGSVGYVTGNVGGNVVGSVASVSGDVGGNILGDLDGNVHGTVILDATQPNYAPSKAGDQMDLVNGPNSTALAAITNNILDLTNTIEGTNTLRQILRLMAAALLGKNSKVGTTVKFRDINDSADRITATVDTTNQRTAVTLNP